MYKKECLLIVERLNKLLPNKRYIIAGAYNLHRLESDNGGATESAYMTFKNLCEWLQAYKRGILAGMEGN